MRQTYQTGQLAEWLCIAQLWLSGWRILAKRWRCPYGEIDIIAKRGHNICFIEVKARQTHEAALSCISATQQQRITSSAALWLAKHPEYSGCDLRFDLMSVTIWPWPKRHKNIF